MREYEWVSLMVLLMEMLLDGVPYETVSLADVVKVGDHDRDDDCEWVSLRLDELVVTRVLEASEIVNVIVELIVSV